MNSQKRGPWVVSLVLVLLLTALNSNATHFYSPNLSELVKGSDFMFVGEVAKNRRSLLGYRRSTLKMLEPIKGNVPSEVTVKYGESWFQSQVNVPILKEGERYLFFVADIENELLLAGITGSVYYRIDENGEVQCGQEKLLLDKCTENARRLTSTSP